jgi:hypothetical protein
LLRAGRGVRQTGAFVADDDASMLVGTSGGGATYWVRTRTREQKRAHSVPDQRRGFRQERSALPVHAHRRIAARSQTAFLRLDAHFQRLYAMLPYQFKSDNPGAHGAKGDRLIQVEDDTLGTSDKATRRITSMRSRTRRTATNAATRIR